MIIEEALKNNGFDSKEIKVYLSLLEINPASASAIATKSNMQRELTYAVLGRLKKKGLITQTIRNQLQEFRAIEPKQILKQIEEKKLQFEEIIPQLEKLRNIAQSDTPIIETYEGTEGIKSVLNRILNHYKTTNSKSPLLGYGSAGKLESVLRWSFPHFVENRVQSEIKFKGIYNKTKESIKKRNLPLSEIKFLPKEAESPSFYLVYPGNVCIIIFNNSPVAININSNEIFQSYTTYFEILWKSAK